MSRSIMSTHRIITLVLLAAFFARTADPALAAPVIKLQNWEGTIDFAPEGTSSFTLDGTSSHLGRFSAYGEIDLVSGEEEDSLDGEGVVVFEAANGDLLVGVTTWQVDGDGVGQLNFSWRDFIELGDGTIIFSTGRFEHDRPPGLVVIAIIAILIGLLLPAVQ
jgi:hypothetical protein